MADKVVRGESAESLLDQVASGSTEVSAGPVSVDAPVQMMLEKDKLDYLVKLILDKRELPKYWPMIAHHLYGADLDEADVAYITARVPFAQPTPEQLAPKEKEANIAATNIQETASEQQETSTAVYPVKQILSVEGYKQIVDWILENDIRALFFGDSHSVPDTILPVEIVKILADRGMLHSVMIEFAVNRDDAETEKRNEDFINSIGLKEATTLQDIKMAQDPSNHQWHFAHVFYVLHRRGIPYHVFGSPRHLYTRETLKKGLSQVPSGKVMLIMVGTHHLYPPELVNKNPDHPDSAYGLLSQQARNEYGVNIAGFNGCWSSNEYKYGHDYMKEVIYRNQYISKKVTQRDKFYEKVLFPNIKDMSDKGEPFENTRRFKSCIY